MSKSYGNKRITGDSACPTCRAAGRDSTGNHLQHWINDDSGEEWVYCSRCGHYEKVTDANRADLESVRQVKRELSDEEREAILAEVSELPQMALTARGISEEVSRRYGVRVGLSPVNREPVSYFTPKDKDGFTVAYKVRILEPKGFYAVGSGSGCDFFGEAQARLGDVHNGKLFVFEDELSAMSGYQALISVSKSTWKPACVALPDGAGSAASVFARRRKFVEGFQEIVVCMDNDAAGEEAVSNIRAMHPNIKVARIPKGKRKDGKDIKDANDLLMDGRITELNNLLRFNAAKESPAGSATVSECIEDAMRKPEWGIPYPWEGLTKLTYGIRFGELISIGGGVSCGKTLIGHELASHLIMKHKQKCGMFMLEETVGNTIKNIAGKSAGITFHKPDADFDPELLRNEALKYDGSLFLYKNFGQNDWEDIKRCIRFWVVEHGVKFIFLDNVTCLVSHLTSTEINSEIAKIGAELAAMCNELQFTCFVFSHLNPPKAGLPHEEGGAVQEAQFTGSRALMRFSQLMLGFERNKQADGDWKNLSQIRLLKDRNFGQSGTIGTKYNPVTGQLVERAEHEYDPKNPFVIPGESGDSHGPVDDDNGKDKPF
ncbi:DnaB-like replicative helicase [Aeromonas phage BUCT695]|uniref:DnaB-like replicative helicase n=1 Tax=Aeromonas phage BUCT695 TaxID=2908630 RepID=UPI002329718A|nr:DnaB-like replicative helicase [Aeromonas phage BUCT695]UIW10531.1 primase/helicase [Aeromonas phage BUCT695]